MVKFIKMIKSWRVLLYRYVILCHLLQLFSEWLLLEAVLKQFVSPYDEHCVLETCREL